jgi:hypothetical protein
VGKLDKIGTPILELHLSMIFESLASISNDVIPRKIKLEAKQLDKQSILSRAGIFNRSQHGASNIFPRIRTGLNNYLRL